jgi:hypothetical protein
MKTNEQDVSTWVGAIELATFCVPPKIRLEVLYKLLDNECDRHDRIITRYNFDPTKLKNWHAENEAVSLIIQTLVRSITNSHSSDDAATILFREHRMGTGSGWLPDYLDGLPGLTVDLKRCRAISDSNDRSKLTAPWDMGTSGHPLG